MSDERHVLVIEDDLPTRELFVYVLTRAGIPARAAHNGRQALEMCRERRPAVVLTDLRLPGLDGYAIARELHAELGEAAPPIIAVTGFVPADDDPRIEQAHFRRLLIKPVTPALLVEAVREALDMADTKEPKQNIDREPAKPEPPEKSNPRDREEPGGRASKGTAD